MGVVSLTSESSLVMDLVPSRVLPRLFLPSANGIDALLFLSLHAIRVGKIKSNSRLRKTSLVTAQKKNVSFYFNCGTTSMDFTGMDEMDWRLSQSSLANFCCVTFCD